MRKLKDMTEHYYAVILAGGGGTRLWPLSRTDKPKQMLHLVGDRTLFQITVDRLDDLFPVERILVVTSAAQADELQVQCPQLIPQNFLLEPSPRNTAPAIGLAAAVLKQRDPQAVMAVVTADHYIENVELFLKVLKAAEEVACDGHLVTLGIEPTYAATGFGYIQMGESQGGFSSLPVRDVLRFKEKPDADTAKRMIEQGNHVWNSGMFIWCVTNVLAEIEKQMPVLGRSLERISATAGQPGFHDVLQTEWANLESESKSIDFGIMEGAEDVSVIPAAGLGWNDIGSWDALFDVGTPDEFGNIINHRDSLSLNTHNTLVYGNGLSQRMIVTIGVRDLVIVDTGDVLLVCHREQAQDVREIVRLLKEQQRKSYL
jgi:mannose-1-phosphate guanylyltransferase